MRFQLEDLTESIPDRVKIVKKAKVTKLIQEGDKTVGVEYERDGKKVNPFVYSDQARTYSVQFTEHGVVILATGGYAADFTSDSLLKKHRPEYFDLVCHRHLREIAS